MLWLLQYRSVQILIILWLLQVIYTAYATLRSDLGHRVKSIIIIILFGVSYYSIIMSGVFLGTPNFSDDEEKGILNGYSVFNHNGKKEFAVMITTDTGPILITLPYDIKTESMLDTDMKKFYDSGKPTLIRKRSSSQIAKLPKDKSDNDKSEFDNGAVVTFDFTDQVLTAKTKPKEK